MYQYDFSKNNRHVFDLDNRKRKALTVQVVLREAYGGALAGAQVLSVGASTGIIENYLADYCKAIVGVDIDCGAVRFAQQKFARSNLGFMVADAMNLPCAPGSFDVILCNHVYEHVPDAPRLMQEIWRLLKPGGICYFAAGNRLAINEPHYNLPFLSLLPKPLAHLYMRVTGRGERYYETHLTYWGLRRLVSSFSVEDFTRKVVEDPERFSAGYMLKTGSPSYWLARAVVRHFKWLCPGYIWILHKETHYDPCAC